MNASENTLERHRWTVAEYHRMAETGTLAPDARVELIDGEIIDKAPVGPVHAGIVDQLTVLMVRGWRTPRSSGCGTPSNCRTDRSPNRT